MAGRLSITLSEDILQMAKATRETGAEMQQYFMVMAEICQAGLNDPSPGVQRVALQALGGLATWAADDKQTHAVRGLLPALIQASLHC